jgi:hypothetical protein
LLNRTAYALSEKKEERQVAPLILAKVICDQKKWQQVVDVRTQLRVIPLVLGLCFYV